MNIFLLENKVAIVTGALGLLGKQHCIALANAGANVVVADMDEKACCDFVITLGTNHLGIKMDVTDEKSLEACRDIIMKKYGHIDVLINNAAINDKFEDASNILSQSKFENYPLDLWQRSLQVNITGVFLCSRVFGMVMANQNSGSIINIASTYGIVAPDQNLYLDEYNNQTFYKTASYSTTKGAVISFTRFLAAYWGAKNVRVNSLSPGGVENNQENFFINNYSKKTPLGRMSSPTDYHGAIVFLASDASSYMTGANLVVDGGFTAI